MKNIYSIIGVALIMLSAMLPNSVMAADAKTTAEACWNEGVRAYEERDYRAAVDAFTQVIELGYPSANAYFNLANAYFKLGQEPSLTTNRSFSEGELGRAILNYHRALRLNPAMVDARYNLELAVDHTNDTEAVPESFIATLWRGMRNTMTSNGWTIISLVMLGVMLVLVILYLLSNIIVLRKICFFSSIILLVGFLLTTLLAISSRSAILEDTRAVIITNDLTPVHASPESASKVIRQPSQGVTVRVGREHGEWSEIIFVDGEKGWIRSSQLERI